MKGEQGPNGKPGRPGANVSVHSCAAYIAIVFTGH